MRANVSQKTDGQQNLLIPNPIFPSTRFQGSKLKIAPWIEKAIKDIRFDTALDAFGGTGSVGYMLKTKGKLVTYNDILKFNWLVGLALIENEEDLLNQDDVDFIIKRHADIRYSTFVQDTFQDIYFTEEENQWIDTVATNIKMIDSMYKKALAYFALFQSCIIKRPFNLFHRKNLYLRFSEVERKCGDKATWDKPFNIHFRNFAEQANRAVFSNGRKNRCLNLDVFDVEGKFDLIYIDTPYISSKGTGTDYLGFYHFLEGLVHYENWRRMIDEKTKHKRLKGNASIWTDRKLILSAFERLFDKFQDSILVVSYRADGIPTIEQLINLMKKFKQDVYEIERKHYQYALSANRTEEALIIGM